MASEEFTRALESTREIQLTVTGRASGREVSFPVWFVTEGDTLYLVPIHGPETNWYKNVLKDPTVRLAAGGAQVTGRATPITDPARVNEIVDKFRAKYGDVETYYPRHDVAVAISLA